MAMIICTECGKEISDKAKACPHCGCPIIVESVTEEKANELSGKKKKERKPIKKALCLWLLLPIELIIMAILGIIFDGDEITTETTIVMGQRIIVFTLVNVVLGLLFIFKAGKAIREGRRMKKPFGKEIAAILLCLVFIILNGFVMYAEIYTNNLITNSKEAQIAATACEDLQLRMKNPASLELHEVLVGVDFSDNLYVYIDCSAENGFGGTTRTTHIYKNETYLGDWEDQTVEIKEAKSLLDLCLEHDMYKSIPLSSLNRKLK